MKITIKKEIVKIISEDEENDKNAYDTFKKCMTAAKVHQIYFSGKHLLPE